MPVWLDAAEYATVAAACERLIPPLDGHPGAPGARRRRLRRQPARRVHVRPAADLGRRPVLGPPRRRRVVRRTSCRCRRLEELAWRTRIEGSQGIPEREFNGPGRRLAGALPRRHRRARRRLRRRCPPTSRTPASTPHPTFKALLYTHACEGAYGAPEYGGNRDLAGWRAIEFRGRRAAARLHRRGGLRT